MGLRHLLPAAGALIALGLQASAAEMRDAAAPAKPVGTGTFFLRQSISDLHLFSSLTPVDEAEGAVFSWWDDRVADDTAWSADGLVGYAYSFDGDTADKPGDLTIAGLSFAPYFEASHEDHSRTTGKDRDAYAYGGSFEIALDTYDLATHVFRYSGKRRIDRVDGTDVFQSTFEWLPVDRALAIGWPTPLLPKAIQGGGLQWLARFNPELKVQYDSALDDSLIAFSGRSEALRIGPEATLILKPQGIPSGPFDLTRLRIKTTYHWAFETLSGRDFDWLSAALIYNLDEAGYFALSATYKMGANEDTGADTDVVKVTLSGKY